MWPCLIDLGDRDRHEDCHFHRQSMISSFIRSTLQLAAAMLFFGSIPAFAQDRAAASPPAQDDPVTAPRPPQIDLNLINLPTTMSIARHHSYFRLTHRFASDLRRGDLGD